MPYGGTSIVPVMGNTGHTLSVQSIADADRSQHQPSTERHILLRVIRFGLERAPSAGGACLYNPRHAGGVTGWVGGQPRALEALRVQLRGILS